MRATVLLFLLIALRLAAEPARIVLVAGGERDSTGIPAMEAQLKEPFAAEFGPAGSLFIVEMVSGNRLLRVARNSVLELVAGSTSPEKAAFNGPHNIAILPQGDILVADTWNGKIQRVNPETGASTQLPGYGVPVEQAKSNGPYCITLSPDGASLFIANLRQVLRLDLKTSRLTVAAGNGTKGIPQDGALAVDAPLADPRAAAPDRLGNLYILERGGNALRVVDASGRIRTVVNRSGEKGKSGDDGPAAEARMNGPKHLCVDAENNVLIADAENNLVRKYVPRTGQIVRIAGTGAQGSSGLNGDPLQCQLARPHGVSVHPTTGEIYITDSYNNRILRITR